MNIGKPSGAGAMLALTGFGAVAAGLYFEVPARIQRAHRAMSAGKQTYAANTLSG